MIKQQNQHKEALPNGVIINNIKLYNGEALEVMDTLIANKIKVDAIICDPPFG